MIVLEGTDLTGKTTFAKKFRELLSGSFYVGAYDHCGLEEAKYTTADQWIIRAWNPYAIMDRFIMSNVAYDIGLGRKTQTETLSLFNSVISGIVENHSIPLITVVFVAHQSKLAERYKKKNREEAFTLNQSITVNDVYNTLYQNMVDHRGLVPFPYLDLTSIITRFCADFPDDGVYSFLAEYLEAIYNMSRFSSRKQWHLVRIVES